MDEIYVVLSIIDKLPQSWKDVKKNHKHKEEDINLNQFTHLQIEVSIRALKNGGNKFPNTSTIKMVEKKSINHGTKRRNNHASSSYKGKSAKITKPDNDGS